MMTTMSRAESAAATRRALLVEAAALLDTGGPDAVTLREVGARAGVSRGAPYRHFDNKDSLLIAVAAEGWQRLGDDVLVLRDDPQLRPLDALRAALVGILAVSHHRPYLYRLMFDTPAGDRASVNRAAQRLCDGFLAIVTKVVGDGEAERYAALLLTAVHGAAGLESSGLLHTDKWQTTADELIENFVVVVDGATRGRRHPA
jgi:AcrR family transcriptional regulator